MYIGVVLENSLKFETLDYLKMQNYDIKKLIINIRQTQTVVSFSQYMNLTVYLKFMISFKIHPSIRNYSVKAKLNGALNVQN